MMPSSMTPGQIIREARLAHGLSLGQLASAVGRTASSVRRWEKDDAMPTAAVLDQLADLLEIDRRELELSPDSEDTTATGGEAAVDLPDGGSSAGDEPPSGEILGESSPGSDDAANGSDHVVEVVVVSAPGDVISAETATPAGVPSATRTERTRRSYTSTRSFGRKTGSSGTIESRSSRLGAACDCGFKRRSPSTVRSMSAAATTTGSTRSETSASSRSTTASTAPRPPGCGQRWRRAGETGSKCAPPVRTRLAIVSWPGAKTLSSS